MAHLYVRHMGDLSGGQMIKKKVGRFINLSSFRSKLPINGTSLYSSIKSFNNIFFKSIGLEYGRFDITSNSISIGFADTKLLKNLPKESIQKYKKSIVKNRFLDKDEFFNSLNQSQYEKITEFFQRVPKIEHIFEYTNAKGEDKKVYFRKIEDFFLLG